MSQNDKKLKNLLMELFQLDQPDLDFGIYRIIHARSAEVTQFLDKDLHKPLVVSKDAQKPQEIQAITASTITSKAVVSGINIASAHFRENYLK